MGVNITDPLLPFVDYPAFSNAADAAIAFLEEYKATGIPPTVFDTALKCDRIRVRKEWRRLKYHEKKSYIEAEKCLMRQPNYGLTANETHSFRDGLTGVSNRIFHILRYMLKHWIVTVLGTCARLYQISCGPQVPPVAPLVCLDAR